MCRCPENWGGNPHQECFQCRLKSSQKQIGPKAQLLIFFSFFLPVQCQRDDDCPFDKACKSNECVDPCPLTICGSRAKCKAERHKGICVCPPGLQGNPYVSCTEVGCQSHDDCSYDEKCDFPTPSSGKRECVRLCVSPSCAQGARCEAKNHREICTCNYPLQGDGYTSCLPRKLLTFKKLGLSFWQP